MKKHLTGLIAVFMAVAMMFSVLPAFAVSYTIGDVDGNGKISADDARLALRAAIELENYASGSAQALACDADNDGAITTSDARLILRASVNLEKLHQHAYTVETVTKAATCTEPGIKTFTCSCGETITETIPATGVHTFDGGKITTAATCKNTGVKTYTCTSCGTTKTETVPKKTTHTWNGGAVTTPATCLANGEKTYTCSVCGATKTEVIPAPGSHTWDGGTVTKSATCAVTGVKTYTCSACGEKKTETIAKTSTHTWNSGAVTKAATCVADGVKTYTCSVCSATKTETITKTNLHTFGAGVITTPATCVADGVETFTCTVCSYKMTSSVPKTGVHTWNSGAVTTAATCAATGVKTFTCTVCSATKTETIAKNSSNHTGGTIVRNAVTATCTTAGQTGDTCCNGCGAVLTASTTIAALGHNYQTINEATCYQDGDTYQKCTRCGYETEKTTAQATGQHNVQLVTEAPSCTAAGYSVRKCVNGECPYYEQDSYSEGAPATGHSFPTTPTSVVAPTCNEQGYSVFTCPVCEAVEQRNFVEATGHTADTYTTTKAATCTDDGIKTTSCKVCGETITTAIPATGHSILKSQDKENCELRMACTTCGKVFSTQEYHTWRPATTVIAATCTETGTEKQTCRYCGTERTNVVPAKGHNVSGSTTLVPATCTTDGSITYGGGTCSNCNETIEPGVVTLAAKGHQPGAAATCTSAQICETCNETIIPALGHDYKNANNVLGSTLDGFYCNRCGQKSTNKAELVNTFNGLVNNIKRPAFYNVNNRTATLLGKSNMSTTYTKFDFGIYTNAVKGLYDDEMNTNEETYDKPKKVSLNFVFQVAYQSYVSRLAAEDLDGITVERLNGIDGATILNGYADSYTVGSTTVNAAQYKQTKINGNVIKVTVDVKNEYMTPTGSNVSADRTVLTPINKLYNYDIRSERDLYDDNWQLVERDSGDGYEISMAMTLEKLDADLKAVFYFDEATYNPIAAVYELDSSMAQKVDMTFRIGIFSLDGIIKPIINTKTSSVYLFSDYFTPLT